MYQLAAGRRRAGQPVWDRTIRLGDVFHNEAMSFEERRDAIVRRLRDSRWLRDHDEGDELHQFIEELADTADKTEFNGPWDEIYDIADVERVWIDTMGGWKNDRDSPS
jgi:hypothetical protein